MPSLAERFLGAQSAPGLQGLQGLQGTGLTMGGQGLAPYGLRYSGEGVKGKGFMGLLGRPGGGFSSELSAESDIDGRNVEYPLMVPTLNRAELNHLLSGGQPTQEIYAKAQEHAKRRLDAGLSPFADSVGLRYPVPKE